MKLRARRLRQNTTIRKLSQEHWVSSNDLIYPVFIKDTKEKEAIASMPNIYRHNIDSLLRELEILINKGLGGIALFPVIEEKYKTELAEEAYNPEALTQRTIRKLKQEFPDLVLITDLALDPYTNHGHDGLIKNGEVLNDETVEILSKMALVQAEAGSDIVAPSDMMDGRVAAIRDILEKNNFKNTLIMSYTAKYASCLYGPFRDALSVPLISKQNSDIPKDKKSYQMNPANSKEALKELKLDIKEGADIVMVKPATWYLDIIKDFRANTELPIAAYQVSAEYSMIHAAAEKGYIKLEEALEESLISIKRAGADMILSYFTKDWLNRAII